MSKAAKRERQRQNRMARREYEAAIEKRKRFWRSARGFLIILVPVAALFVFFVVRGNNNSTPTSNRAPKMTIDPTKTYTATVDTSEGTFTIALDAATAPKSVNNFVHLADKGFFDGLDVFRVATELFQTGSPTNTAVGGPGYTVQAELPEGSYQVGSVAWGKKATDKPGTAGSQWFVITGPGATSLPAQYGIIGQVTEGQDVLTKISALAPASGDGKPTKTVTMRKVTISES